MFALRELAIQMRALVGVIVKWILCCMCDLDNMARRFSELNHDPRHVSTQTEHRNFEARQYYCNNHDANHDLPRQGVDLHEGTYTRSPWPRRGKRTGLGQPDAEVSIIGF